MFDDFSNTHYGRSPGWGLDTPMLLDDESGRSRRGNLGGNQQLATRGGNDDRLGLWGAGGGLAPARMNIDIINEKDKYVVKAEVPGIPRDKLKVTLNDGMLTLSGERSHEVKEEDKDRHYIRQESSYGSVSRSIRLPKDVDPEKVTAHYENGQLVLNVAKLPNAGLKQREIAIEDRASSSLNAGGSSKSSTSGLSTSGLSKKPVEEEKKQENQVPIRQV